METRLELSPDPSRNGSGPLVSVITATYDRRRFLRAAVRSVLRQSLPRDLFEIIVVKGFTDPELDGFLQAEGVRSFFLPYKESARKVAEGVRQSRGGILCILDDDDEFSPSKLEVVLRLFSRDPRLGYYHNHQSYIDENGLELPPLALHPEAARRIVSLGTVEVSPDSPPKEWAKLGDVLAEFNNSSISVRREIIAPLLSKLDQFDGSIDSFFFYTALASGCTIRADAQRLTRYRVHSSNASLTKSDERIRRDYEALRTWFAEDGLDRSHRATHEIDGRLAVTELYLVFRDPTLNRGRMRIALRALKPVKDTMVVHGNRRLILLARAYLLAPRTMRAIYQRAADRAWKYVTPPRPSPT